MKSCALATPEPITAAAIAPILIILGNDMNFPSFIGNVTQSVSAASSFPA
ncbi:Uncharacterised protein [Vibrio cholerae]|nr:Uncharacterised protein [Vibrio cholerae]CSB77230.1 Uncharacterised protein [Vibrio cholerae]CSC70035.1 Uncharacterised protein [Vibrio cholerae]CSH90036.1 Uncharacterised protein [Vibrio cholerae]